MSPEQMNYIDELAINLKFLQAIKQGNIEQWAPDSPVINILLADLGRGIADNFFNLNEREKVHLFSHIENGMNSRDEDLSTAVATGLVEALVAASDRNPGLWPGIQSALGIESKNYAVTWKNFDYSLPLRKSSGSLASVIRYEKATGQSIQGKFHRQKAEGRLKQLERWLRNNPTATPGDRAAAENVIRDMQNALRGD